MMSMLLKYYIHPSFYSISIVVHKYFWNVICRRLISYSLILGRVGASEDKCGLWERVM